MSRKGASAVFFNTKYCLERVHTSGALASW